MTDEAKRLAEARARTAHWRRWGPFLAERQWGTVREDYSPQGDAWDYFPHDHARSRAYRWGEDGLLGLCDNHQRLCFAVALWNERDPILKERLFGLTGPQGNHGEDVKELYFYLDGTPTHAYMRALYKYPAGGVPVPAPARRERAARARRSRSSSCSTRGSSTRTGTSTWRWSTPRRPSTTSSSASPSPTAGREAAPLHVLPTLWFRNTWAWEAGAPRPRLRADASAAGMGVGAGRASDARGSIASTGGSAGAALHRERDEPAPPVQRRESPGASSRTPFTSTWCGHHAGAVNPAREGTKTGGPLSPDPRLRRDRDRCACASPTASPRGRSPGDEFEQVFARRRTEADAFYATVIPAGLEADARRVMRQALAGLLWSKQWYHYDVQRWLRGDPTQPPPPPERRGGRNRAWTHLYNEDVVSVPDKWEYPWYASWDLAFHTVALALVDPDYAKDQLILFTREWYMHPDGQIPAYEWALGDVNPPVLPWAALRVYEIEKAARGQGDIAFLKRVFHKYLLSFTWWVNRKDPGNKNVFEGGFLGLDNIGIFDRSAPLPTGGTMEQSDGTAWVGMFCLTMLNIAATLALDDPVYEDIASKFFEHFVYISGAMNDMAGEGIELWDAARRLLLRRHPAPRRPHPAPARALHGRTGSPGGGDHPGTRGHEPPAHVLPADDVVPAQSAPPGRARGAPGDGRRPRAVAALPGQRGEAGAHPGPHARRGRVPVTVRHPLPVRRPSRASLRAHHRRPRVLDRLRARRIDHRALRRQLELARARLVPPELPHREGAPALRDLLWRPLPGGMPDGVRTAHVPGGRGAGAVTAPGESVSGRCARTPPGARTADRFRTDPRWRDLLLFYEYFDGDTGAGLGASHQTGWTALVAQLLAQHPR